MPLTARAIAPMTEEQFFALPISAQRTELLDGEVIVSPSPSVTHQRLVGRLFRVLAAWADAHPPTFCGLSPLDVHIAPNRVVQPDLFLLLTGLANPNATIAQVPELVVEVLSNNRSYDRLAKRLVYAEAGVSEYWMVDPEFRQIEVVYRGQVTVIVDQLRSAVAPGLTVDIGSLF